LSKVIVVLAPEVFADKIVHLAGHDISDWRIHAFNSSDQLVALFRQEKIDLLLSFATGVIVPSWILEQPGLTALNLHAASPEYPGRDPHHFAVYEQAARYGATLHFMVEQVDAGPIIDVEWVAVEKDAFPIDLLKKANEAALDLLRKYLPDLLQGKLLQANSDCIWQGVKRSRKDFLELCRVGSDTSETEFQKRQKACQMPGYSNLHTVIHGKRFMIESG
jgi:methionyl-tRNA formyltransferase